MLTFFNILFSSFSNLRISFLLIFSLLFSSLLLFYTLFFSLLFSSLLIFYRYSFIAQFFLLFFYFILSSHLFSSHLISPNIFFLLDDPISDSILTALYRYLCGYGNALLSDPALHRVVYGLMTKLFKRLISAFKKLGARVVFASFSRIIVHTDKEVLLL